MHGGRVGLFVARLDADAPGERPLDPIGFAAHTADAPERELTGSEDES